MQDPISKPLFQISSPAKSIEISRNCIGIDDSNRAVRKLNIYKIIANRTILRIKRCNTNHRKNEELQKSKKEAKKAERDRKGETIMSPGSEEGERATVSGGRRQTLHNFFSGERTFEALGFR